MLEYGLFLVFPMALALAAVFDLLTMTIPNRISIVLVVAFFVAVPFSHLDTTDVLWHMAAGLGMLVLGIVLFSLGGIGGGDAKLLAAVALWFGFENLLQFVLIGASFGGVLSILLLKYRASMPPLWLCRQPWAMRLHEKTCGIPYGIALALAGLAIYPSTKWLTSLAV